MQEEFVYVCWAATIAGQTAADSVLAGASEARM